jgi:hypothetical protein
MTIELTEEEVAIINNAPSSTNRPSQRRNRMSGSQSYRKLILVSTTDDRCLVRIFSDPQDSIRVHKHFHPVHIFKHYEFHVAS